MKFDPRELDLQDSHHLLAGALFPRPLAFVSTIGEDGVFNVAPFGFFCPISSKPMLIGFTISSRREGQKKDTLLNIEFSNDFVINVVTEPIMKAMNQSAKNYPSHVDEFKEIGLTPLMADIVKSPRIAESPINLECNLIQFVKFKDPPRSSTFVIGEVVRMHVKDEVFVNGKITSSELGMIGRLWGDYYCRVTDRIAMKRPEDFPSIPIEMKE